MPKKNRIIKTWVDKDGSEERRKLHDGFDKKLFKVTEGGSAKMINL